MASRTGLSGIFVLSNAKRRATSTALTISVSSVVSSGVVVCVGGHGWVRSGVPSVFEGMRACPEAGRSSASPDVLPTARAPGQACGKRYS